MKLLKGTGILAYCCSFKLRFIEGFMSLVWNWIRSMLAASSSLFVQKQTIALVREGRNNMMKHFYPHSATCH